MLVFKYCKLKYKWWVGLCFNYTQLISLSLTFFFNNLVHAINFLFIQRFIIMTITLTHTLKCTHRYRFYEVLRSTIMIIVWAVCWSAPNQPPFLCIYTQPTYCRFPSFFLSFFFNLIHKRFLALKLFVIFSSKSSYSRERKLGLLFLLSGHALSSWKNGY